MSLDRQLLVWAFVNASAAPLSHVVGFDDAPFAREYRGDVLTIGAVFAANRLDGVLSTRVRRDGANAARRLADVINRSRFAAQLQLVMLQGIALAGFNVVDVPELYRRTGLPVLVVARRAPDMAAIRSALFNRVPGGERKWRLIQRLGPMEPLAGVHVQRWGIESAAAEAVLTATAVNGLMPEPLRTAHLIAGGVTTGESRQRT